MRRTTRRKPRQIALWPTTAAICPQCHGAREVYHRATQPRVEVIGGKRMPCPTCEGSGTVQIPSDPSGGAAETVRRDGRNIDHGAPARGNADPV